MDQQSALDEIDATLKAKGFVDCGPGFADYEGCIKIHGDDIPIKLSIPDLFFVAKPRLFIQDFKNINPQILAHITSDEGICYASAVGLPLDSYQPGRAILRVIAEAEKAIESSYAGRGPAEVAAEYSAYWREVGRNFRLIGTIAELRKVKVKLSYCQYTSPGGAKFYGVRHEGRFEGYAARKLRSAELRVLDSELGPVGAIKVPSTLQEFRTWLVGQTDLSQADYEKILISLTAANMVIFSAPNCVIGFRIKLPPDLETARISGSIRAKSLPSFVDRQASQIELIRYEGRHSDIGTIAQRNLVGMKTLGGVKIALIGCGTIGGHLAKFLVQSGAGADKTLDFYDTQLLQEGNLGRHLLGYEAVDKPKADALEAELMRFHPDLKVKGHALDAVKHWKQIKNSELIIDATGDWNVQIALNALFRDDKSAKCRALLHSYIFANGAGVQSFLNLNDDHACFRCLKPEFSGPWRYPPANPKDKLNIQEASCGDGAYIPYSVGAAVSAASLAVNAALDWINDKPGHRLRSAIVDMERGRYQKALSPTPTEKCPACSGLRNES